MFKDILEVLLIFVIVLFVMCFVTLLPTGLAYLIATFCGVSDVYRFYATIGTFSVTLLAIFISWIRK